MVTVRPLKELEREVGPLQSSDSLAVSVCNRASVGFPGSKFYVLRPVRYNSCRYLNNVMDVNFTIHLETRHQPLSEHS